MKVFISYRRSDTQHIAGRLAECLDRTPGIGKVFLDTDGIEYGRNFESATDKELLESDVCLLLIGDDWVGARGDDTPDAPDRPGLRIQAETDLVRHETALALAGNGRLIPVLVDGATMPSRDSLPPDVRPITSINAVFLRHASFKNDLRLVENAIFSRRPGKPISRFFSRHPFLTFAFKVTLGVLIALAALILLGVIHNISTDGRALSETFGSRGLVVLIIVAWLTAGGALAAWLALRR